MNENLIFGLLLFIIVILLIIFMIVAKTFLKNRGTQKMEILNLVKQKDVTIGDLIEIVSDKRTSREHIFKAIRFFLANFKIPPKKNGIAPNSASVYLQFVALVSAHPKSDAKLISYLDNELKKVSPEYVGEIDEAENRGINKRRAL